MSNNSSLTDKPSAHWSPSEVIAPATDWLERLLGWWFKMTIHPSLKVSTRYIDREKYHKARLVSTLAFLYFVLTAITAYYLIYTSLLTLISILACFTGMVCVLIANRTGRTTLAGILMVLVFEVAMSLSMIGDAPLDTPSLATYYYFLIGELLAASLLPMSGVFLVALLNSIFIFGDLYYEPHTQALGLYLSTQFAAAALGPITIQIIAAGVIALWVFNSAHANERANRAEMVATLEHTVAAQLEEENKTKQELEESIQRVVQEQANAANNRFAARISYPPARVLWPLVGVINSLTARLQRTEQIDGELTQLKQAITMSTEILDQAANSPQKSLQMKKTGTDIDLLLLAAKRLHETTMLAHRFSSHNQSPK